MCPSLLSVLWPGLLWELSTILTLVPVPPSVQPQNRRVRQLAQTPARPLGLLTSQRTGFVFSGPQQ